MKKVKLILNFDELDLLLKLIESQILKATKKECSNSDQMIIALMGEFYQKHLPKTCFWFPKTKTCALTIAQAYAFVETIQSGWFTSDNQWTRNILQIHHHRLHKQLTA